MYGIGIGESDFKILRIKKDYYIDKTKYIKDIIDNRSKVLLITRPRRFGKTLNMSMLRYYFDCTKKDSKELFKGLKIKNIELKAEGGISKLTATIENKSGEDYSGEKVNIVFENKDGTEYARLEAVLPAVDNQKTNEIDAGTTADIANAYDFKIEPAE